MAAPDFPASPTVGQIYTASSGIVYKWDGAVWTTTGVAQTAYWTDTGTDLTPTATTRRVTVPGPTANPATGGQTQVVVGSRTSKMRVQSLVGGKWDGLTSNGYYDGANWFNDDAASPSWNIVMHPDAGADSFTLEHRAANAGASAFSLPLQVTGDGITHCTLANASVTAPMLVNNGSIRSSTTVNLPVNYSNSTLNTWINLANTGTIACSGSFVFLLCGASLWWAIPSGSVCALYIGFSRNSSMLQWWKVSASISGSGGNNLPIPIGFGHYDFPAAGSYYYGINVYFNAGIVSTGEAAGSLSVFNMA